MGTVIPDEGGPDVPGPGSSAPALSARVTTALHRLGLAPLQAVLVAVTVGAVGVIGWALLRPPPVAVDARIPMVTVPPPPVTVAPPLAAHAAGAVVAPGLYELPAGARVADLLAAAGGPTPDADLDRVNLAAPVQDGWQVHVPVVGESAPAVVTPGGPGGAPGAPGGGDGGGPLDLNTATAEQLDTLPGVGPGIAAAILEARDRSGGFASVEDLLDVPGIGPTRFERLRDLVVVP